MVGYFFTSNSYDWGTPDHILAAIRLSLGGQIDLDPCSTSDHNKRVQAKTFYAQTGELHLWNGTVFVNHPGDKSGKNSKRWWKKFVQESRRLERPMVWLDFNPNRLATLEPNPFRVCNAIVLLRKRISYISPNKSSPPMNSWVGLIQPQKLDHWNELGTIVVV